MTKELKFQQRILANLQAMLMYARGKGDVDQIRLFELQIKAQKELIDAIQNNKSVR